MIEFKEAAVVAPDSGVPILEPTSLTLTEDRISIIGANGSGKSTLARLINGLVLPVSGSVEVDGLDTQKQGAAVRRKVGYLFTDASNQLIMPTGIEDVALSLRRVIKNRKERDEAALSALKEIGLASKADVSVNALSGGQRQLLALAGVLACTPSILVADEPTTLLDLRWRAHVGALLRSLPLQVIEVTHDLDSAARAERTLVIDLGQVVFDGDPKEAVKIYRDLMFGRASQGATA
ncbi:energy-coupling factor ABC transporter ATP-binding protein [Demequina lignilytica]|uniref:ABC transporter ATP-binding protein n=1 Tax=Demequina lignilytica TaxID=3051663 RepID=A0AAW7M9Y8_9MICO|nr:MULTISPECIES: ABC transporter ATP-binding protein [unclassified Demequina]MDN4479076.1 ABC transporter ATP-binding protein [Demequina sp. SYSU T00039-1]MDN4484377.1 ABC transporter ATP-binding protein [Demequina sp. SYSU T0a273]MDN4489005.1 ABC transporter ATP-binding protein [Demequina sp. SYSU T00039]MDN4491284.1 ABC transporter ATP-binding protein [Demequina sp. SYSU T00068]